MDNWKNVIYVTGDLLGKSLLAPKNFFIFDERIIKIMKFFLQNSEIIYFGDSSVQFGQGSRGFHKDNVDRLNPDGDDYKK